MGFDCDNLSAVDKAEALFRYLEEFSKIRLKVTRNIKEYGSDSISDCIDLQNLPLDNEWIEARFHDSSFNEGPILRVAKQIYNHVQILPARSFDGSQMDGRAISLR